MRTRPATDVTKPLSSYNVNDPPTRIPEAVTRHESYAVPAIARCTLPDFIRVLLPPAPYIAARSHRTLAGESQPDRTRDCAVAYALHLLTEPDQTMSSIAKLLGVSRSTLYTHLPELLRAPNPLL